MLDPRGRLLIAALGFAGCSTPLCYPDREETTHFRRRTEMRMLLDIKIPHETFNAAVRDGSVGEKLQRILEATKPEAVYFTGRDGRRGVTMIVNLDDPSKIPTFAEPWFLTFNADVEFRVTMTPEDLARAGLDALGKKWA
jgi:hypothetical protein